MIDIKENVLELVSEQLSVDKSDIQGSSRLVEDLNADSLDVVELMMSVEERFGITMEDDEAEQIFTVDEIVAAIKSAVSSTLT